jgi:hypothetical protein
MDDYSVIERMLGLPIGSTKELNPDQATPVLAAATSKRSIELVAKDKQVDTTRENLTWVASLISELGELESVIAQSKQKIENINIKKNAPEYLFSFDNLVEFDAEVDSLNKKINSSEIRMVEINKEISVIIPDTKPDNLPEIKKNNEITMALLEEDRIRIRNDSYDIFNMTHAILKKVYLDMTNSTAPSDKMLVAFARLSDSASSTLERLNMLVQKYRREEELRGATVAKQINPEEIEMSNNDFLAVIDDARSEDVTPAN